MRHIILVLLFIPLFSYAQSTANLVKNESKLIWTGKPIVGHGHTGTLDFYVGSIVASPEGQLMSGIFIIDMNTIRDTDIKPSTSAADLENHLKSDDFFSTSQFPQAKFVISNVTYNAEKPGDVTVTGNLTIKGVTNPITFPASVTNLQKTWTVKAMFAIDRTKWGITTSSKSFFTELKDGIIADEIGIQLDLVLR